MVLMNDFTAEPPALREAMVAAVRRVLESGWYVLGSEVSRFEGLWAAACGTQFGVGVGNGMDAIELALRALDIGPGDEVITTPMTAFATVLAILRAGATPILADIDPETALLAPASVRRCISHRTKAMLLVHLYGQVRQMDEWRGLCDGAGIRLIEDCAQAHLASSQGTTAGAFGVAGAYSFYPTKNLGAPGDAGMLVTNHATVAQRTSRLRNYGQSVRYQHPELGMNSRLDEVHAAMLSERLGWLDSFTQRRREIAEHYRREIRSPRIGLLLAPESATSHVYHLFVVNCAQRDALQAHLQARQVQSNIHYPIPIHHQEPCRGLGRDPAGLGHSERHAATCLSLPCHPQLTSADVKTVIDACNSFGAA